MQRRAFLRLATTAAMGSACAVGRTDTAAPQDDPAPSRFLHGVASGDPLADRVVLWTRVSVDPRASSEVEWCIAEDPALQRVVARGSVATDAERDHTVKVDARGLAAGRTYYYRFALDGAVSPIGRTRTLPEGKIDRARLAFTSCANYSAGYFNVYAAIACRDDLDLVVNLGDYIYEYGPRPERLELPERPVAPAHECVTLADYRARYASYRRDGDLQEVHRRHSFVCVWDDHEIANDAWLGGAQNHQQEEGEWHARKAAAVRAYREWMPIRDGASLDPSAIYRSFRFGDLLELLMLDTRLIGRDRHVNTDDDPGLARTDRSLLGAEQERWLLQRLAASQREGVAWRVLGQQVRMGQVRDELGHPRNTDMWDGYPAARDRILEFVETQAIHDLVVVTGDIHSSWAIELYRDPFASPRSAALGVELTVPGVSSTPPIDPPPMDALLAEHPHLRWVDLQHRGYVVVDLTHAGARATWHLLADVGTRHANVPAAKAFAIPRGAAALSECATEGGDLVSPCPAPR